MGIRRGLLFGFLIGSAAATVLAKARRAEAPSEAELPPPEVLAPSGAPGEAAEAPDQGAPSLKETIERVKRRAEQALDAAHDAREEKEAELRREFNEMRRPKQ